MRSALAVVALVPALTACAALEASTITEFESRVAEDPLPKIAAAATEHGGWSIVHQSDGVLEQREAWPVHSVLSLGPSSFHADLAYDAPTLTCVFFLETHGLATLYLPRRIGCEEDLTIGPVKPRIRESAMQILDWGDVPATARPPELR